MRSVSIPVLDIFTGYTTFHGSMGHGDRHFCYQTWVYRFRNEVFRSESEVVYMISFVHYIGYGLFGQIGNSVHGSNFHFFVNGFGLCIQCTTEDIRETNHIVDLVRIVRTSGCHQYIGTGSHGVFIRNLRCRVGKCKHDRRGSHAAYHIL